MELQLFRLMDQYLQALAHSSLLVTHLFSPFASKTDVLEALRLSFSKQQRLLQSLSKTHLSSQTKRLGLRFLNRIYQTCEKQRSFFKSKKMCCELYFNKIYQLINQAIQLSSPFSLLLTLFHHRIANYNLHLQSLLQNQPPFAIQIDKQKQSAKTNASTGPAEKQQSQSSSNKGILELRQKSQNKIQGIDRKSEQFKRLFTQSVQRNRYQNLTINNFRRRYEKSFQQKKQVNRMKTASQIHSDPKLYSKSAYLERTNKGLKETRSVQKRVIKNLFKVNKKFKNIRENSLNQIEVQLPQKGSRQVAILRAFKLSQEVMHVTGQQIKISHKPFINWLQRDKPASLQRQYIRIGQNCIK